jgi:hypothetical protein
MIEASDFVERFPLKAVSWVRGECEGAGYERLFPLQGCKCVLDLVVLGVLEADVAVDTRTLLLRRSVMSSIWKFVVVVGSTHLLQKINQLRERLVRTVLDLIPLERAKVLINRLCEEVLGHTFGTRGP